MDLQSYKRRLAKAASQYSAAKDICHKERSELVKSENYLTHSIEAQQILQKVAQKIQQTAHDRIANVVTHCLASVFGEGAYQFKIHFERKRGKTEARLTFIRDGHEIAPRSGSGGGVLDVASFALRLACLMLNKPSPRRVLVLDEPLKNLSAIYRPAASKLIQTLADELDFQFIIVTHCEEYKVGKVIDLSD